MFFGADRVVRAGLLGKYWVLNHWQTKSSIVGYLLEFWALNQLVKIVRCC